MSVNSTLTIAQHLIPTLNTSVYKEVIQNADGFGGYWGYQGDGVATKQELQSYNQQLCWQIDVLDWWKSSGWGGSQIDQILNDLKDQQTATGVMIKNFGSFANNSGNGTAISADDVRTTAARDGNAANVSNYDVRNGDNWPPNPWPPMPWPPGGFWPIPANGPIVF